MNRSMSPSPSQRSHGHHSEGDGGEPSPERPLSSGGREYNESPPATQYIKSLKLNVSND
jgi:hypothetical protein